MPKQITVEVTAMAYDAQAAEDSRTLQPLTVELEVPVDADNDAQAILTALDVACPLAALRLGHEDQLQTEPEPERPANPDLEAAVQEMRRIANTPYRRPDYAAVPPGQLLAWADMIEQAFTAGASTDCLCMSDPDHMLLRDNKPVPCGQCAGGCSC